jgi:hypothetical protein
MTAFAETLEIVWKDQDIPILSVMTATDEHLAEGKICSHTPAMFRSKKLSSYEILQCLCGRRRLSVRDEGGLATWDGTHLPPLCKIWVGNAYWTRQLGVEN